MIKKEKNIIVSKSFQLALSIIEVCQKFENTAKLVIVKQLLKAETIIEINISKIKTTEVSQRNQSLVISN